MPLITIAAVNLPNWQRDDDVELRVYARTSFIASDGTLVVQGDPSEDESASDNWFARASCSMSGGVLTVAGLQLYSTLDGKDTSDALYSAYFFTTEGERICPFAELESFFLPEAPLNTTWAAIVAAQQGPGL